MLETLKSIDTNLFLFLNSKHNAFFDFIMYWASNKWVWIPFYALLLYVVINNFRKRTVLILVLIGVMITLSDQLSSAVLKTLTERPRPSHEEALADQIHLVNGYSGGPFGFVSSHAANATALALFLISILPHRLKGVKIVLLAYAALVSYSRIYLGVHYPGDVLGGMLLGALLSFVFVRIYKRLEHKFAS